MRFKMGSMPAFFASLLALSIIFAPLAHAQDNTQAIQSQIDTTQQQIDSLQNEIDQLQIQLNNTTAQKQTLQSAVHATDLNIQKLQKQISLSNTQIAQTDRQITLLGHGISTTTSSIGSAQQEIGQALRNLAELGEDPLMEAILSGGTLSDFFDQIVELGSVRDNLEIRIQDLSSLKSTLQTNKNAAQQSRDRLGALQSQLNQQKQSLAIARQSQNELLTQTKNKESSYQNLIATKEAQEKAFEDALADLQSQLAPVSSGTIPPTAPGTLAWPFSPSVMASCAGKAKALGNPDCITQYFGNTDFATKNPQVYNNMGHDGVDIGVPIGTPVEAAASGVVIGTGNTDAVYDSRGRECLSFGKWVMLAHPDGLDTLYAHLSKNTVVSKGEHVTEGEVIGYSGMTGYATGPHLHFGVYAASGVQIMDLGEFRGSGGTPCTDGGAVIPVAPTNAYLNPLSYLPEE